GPAPDTGFPVIYVVDGNAWEPLAADIARLNELELGPAIVVGIGYPTEALFDNARRTYDLTPPGPTPATVAAAGLKSGRAATFLQFIERVVKPTVQSGSKIDSHRQVLFGHSLGGLFAVYVLLTRPDAFTSYVAASPSIWWSDRSVLQSESLLQRQADQYHAL